MIFISLTVRDFCGASRPIEPETEIAISCGPVTVARLPLRSLGQRSIFCKFVGKLWFKFWCRISGTAGGVVTEGQRDLQGTVDA